MSRLIIGITGRRGNTDDGYVQAQAGKDTAALHLIGKYGFTRIALADGVREALFALNPVIVSDRPDPRLSNHIVLADDEKRSYRLQGIVTRGPDQASAGNRPRRSPRSGP